MCSLVAFDFIHLIYNLIYPALLGTFFYEFFKELPSGWSLATRVLVFFIFGLDFIWGKKYYEQIESNRYFDEKCLLGILVCEGGILASLCFAFYAPHPLCFLISITAFTFAVILLFTITGKAIFQSRAFRTLMIFMISAATASMIEWRFSNQWAFWVEILMFYGLYIGYYYFSVQEQSWQSIIMLPSGRILNSPPNNG